MNKELNTSKPLLYKEDMDLGIVMFCPNCNKVSYEGDKCNKCNQLFDRKKQIYSKEKVRW